MDQKRRVPVTAMLGTSMFFSGVSFASTLPYGAIVGIETLGMSGAQYAALMSLGSVVGVILSILVGYISDRLPDRRVLILIAAAAGTVGFGLVYIARSQVAFSLATAVIIPVGFAMFSQNFAFVRVYYNARAPERADFMVSALRTVFSVAWVLIPPLAGYIAAQQSVFDVYLLSAAAYLVCGLTTAWMMTDSSTRIVPPAIIPKRLDGKRGLLPAAVISGLLGILIVNVAMRLVGIAMPLSIVTRLGGHLTDVGVYAGIAALLEIPFMLMWGYLAGRFTRESIIIANALIYALYVFFASKAGSVTEILWLQILNGISSAALLSITISYMQDAIKGRVGLSTSLMDVVGISASLLGAASFAILAVARDYQLVLFVASIIAVLGAVVMLSGNATQMRTRAI